MNRVSGGSSASSLSIERLESRDVGVGDEGAGHARGQTLRRVGQLRADGEQIALNVHELRIEIGIDAAGAHQPEPGVQLVDLAVRVDARIGLADATVVEERGLAGVAGARVDLHVSPLLNYTR